MLVVFRELIKEGVGHDPSALTSQTNTLHVSCFCDRGRYRTGWCRPSEQLTKVEQSQRNLPFMTPEGCAGDLVSGQKELI